MSRCCCLSCHVVVFVCNCYVVILLVFRWMPCLYVDVANGACNNEWLCAIVFGNSIDHFYQQNNLQPSSKADPCEAYITYSMHRRLFQEIEKGLLQNFNPSFVAQCYMHLLPLISWPRSNPWPLWWFSCREWQWDLPPQRGWPSMPQRFLAGPRRSPWWSWAPT